MLRQGASFSALLIAGCARTIVLYLTMLWIAPRFGLRL